MIARAAGRHMRCTVQAGLWLCGRVWCHRARHAHMHQRGPQRAAHLPQHRAARRQDAVLRTQLLLMIHGSELWVSLDIGVGSAHGLETVKWLNGVLEVCTD